MHKLIQTCAIYRTGGLNLSIFSKWSYPILTQVLINLTLGTRVYSKDIDSSTKPLVDFICPILSKRKQVIYGKQTISKLSDC